MPLDPQAQKLLDLARNSGLPPINNVPVAEARTRMAKALTYTGEPESVAQVEDVVITGPGGPLALRHYRPSLAKELPAVIFFHGGGWVLNDLNTHDHLCRALANLSGCAVIAVDYRLAPEHPYPAAVDDAWGATEWVFANAKQIGVDPAHLGVAGDSSGATLAAIVSHLASDAKAPSLVCQALMYPVMDHWTTDTKSYREVGIGYSLSRDLMIWFWKHYLPDGANLNEPRICPLRAKHFNELPQTIVLTAEFDPLRDEGEEYARRLRESGVPVTCSRYDGMMHGFVIQFRLLEKGRLGLAEVATFLHQHLFFSK
jgi:acetyl esterase